MKNKLHTKVILLVMLNLFQHLIIQVFTSLRACQEVIKSTNYYSYYYSPFGGLGGYAQNYQWDWALSGGGIQGVDHIYDVKVGTDNNYYFIASLHGTIGTQLDGAAVTTHNSSLGG